MYAKIDYEVRCKVLFQSRSCENWNYTILILLPRGTTKLRVAVKYCYHSYFRSENDDRCSETPQSGSQ